MGADHFCLASLLSENDSSLLALVKLILQSCYALSKSIVSVLSFFNKVGKVLIDLLLLRVLNVSLPAPFIEAVHVGLVHSNSLFRCVLCSQLVLPVDHVSCNSRYNDIYLVRWLCDMLLRVNGGIFLIPCRLIFQAVQRIEISFGLFLSAGAPSLSYLVSKQCLMKESLPWYIIHKSSSLLCQSLLQAIDFLREGKHHILEAFPP